jgi:hypothetical protein
MYRYHRPTGAIGKFAHLTLLGAGILFVGPVVVGLGLAAVAVVIGLVAAALPFVVVGALGYGPYVMVRRAFGPPRQKVAMELRKVVPPARRFVPEPPRVRPVAAAVEVPVPSEPQPESRPQGVVVRVLKEVVCGAVVGGVLGTLAVLSASSDLQVTGRLLDCAAMGSGIGAVVGFVVGGPRPAPAERRPAVG